MMFLRVFLVAGLLFHKLFWEIWKRKYAGANVPCVAPNLFKRVVKLGKIVLFIFFVVQALFLNILPIAPPSPYWQAVGAFLFIAGLTMSIVGRSNLGRNWAEVEDGRVWASQLLVTHGIYRYVRHPIYAGDLLLVIGLELALQSWLVWIAVFLFAVVIRQTFEEEKLLANHFPEYADYRAHTKRFVPFVI
jgi:protein-S-isoprenylcysteine O-methyltransferase Ste14